MQKTTKQASHYTVTLYTRSHTYQLNVLDVSSYVT